MRELRVEDALMYLDQVKLEFGDRPRIYNEFLDIMKTFKSQQIDTPGVIQRVSNLFQGNKNLVLGFNTFLPEGYKIELPLDESGQPFAVYRSPGQAGVTQILAPNVGAQQQQAPQPPPQQQQPPHMGAPPQGAAGYAAAGYPQGQMPPGAMQVRGVPPGAKPPGPPRGAPPPHMHPQGMPGGMGPPPPPPPPQQQPPPSQQQAQQQPPVEFDHAINYVTTIKKRFASQPETYKKFLEILHTYQKEQRGIKDVLDEVSALFADHPDLLKDFTYFLPDAVQAQAKAQLEQVAKLAEARKMASASKQAIMATAGRQRPGTSSVGQGTGGGRGAASPYVGGQAAGGGQRMVHEPIPFGATQGRSEDKEREICRTAIYGIVSFDPIRPPRR
jgi:paired amphipathic helix protein Sin3a